MAYTAGVGEGLGGRIKNVKITLFFIYKIIVSCIMEISKPNLFKIATRELSHDAVITWLLQWANPAVKSLDIELHRCGMALLQLFLNGDIEASKIQNVDAGRQWEGIDIWAEVVGDNTEKLFLIIENKIFTEEHSNQLVRYKEIAQVYADEHGFSLRCVYVKIGSQTQKTINRIAEKGYRTIDRNNILACLNDFANISDRVVKDYRDFLQHIEDAHQSYNILKIGEWDSWSWIGFYQYIESCLEINMWHFVNNPSGGFWNLCLNWGHWRHFPVYIQVEQGKMCYKIAVAEYETGADNSKTDINKAQDFVHAFLLNFAKEQGMADIRRPYILRHAGDYRTIAVIDQDKWLGQSDTLVDKAAVVARLENQLGFYKKFAAAINTLTYADADIEFVEQND
jgi:hypothetical protein